MDWLTMTRWSPYAVGVGIGLLSCGIFVFMNKTLGCSTAFARTSGMIERLLRGEKVLEKDYYRKVPPVFNWEVLLILGVVVGAAISALSSGDFSLDWVPSAWAAAFGSSPAVRFVAALAGGVLLGFGARWAGGCTSGHGISGVLQLAVSSWIAACCFFAGGIAAAMLLYKVLGS
jgi:uncharacterized protein